MGTEFGVIEIIKEVACKESAHLNDDLREDLALDSLDRVELTMHLEEAFDIEIDDKKAETTRTVKDVVELVSDIVNGPGA